MFQITRKTLPALALATTIAGFSGAGWAADPWAVEAGDSEIEFTGTQLGAAFEGEFKSFTAEIVFSPDDLAGSSVKVLIDIASVDTANGDRDSQIVSP
ncbi:MAG TPA: YceI family protein, partial [Thalassospira sp.]|nr:YceI family protein [Thalassospira sp.]